MNSYCAVVLSWQETLNEQERTARLFRSAYDSDPTCPAARFHLPAQLYRKGLTILVSALIYAHEQPHPAQTFSDTIDAYFAPVLQQIESQSKRAGSRLRTDAQRILEQLTAQNV